MKNKKYKLTISILTSNRKDTLPKTLESIKPILDNVSSELIITDTGCDDELLEVIRRYTDKIVKFTWCNDFAKARNVGLKMAQGEWFMFLDDDEWFEDVEPIIEFFELGESEKYNVIHYLVRNYGDFEGKTWLDVAVERGIKIREGIEFVDTIHEHFSEIKPPIKLLNCFVHHFGYVYKTDEDKKKHFLRNYELLVENLNKEPHVSRHYTHLIKGFNNQQEYKKSLELAWRALDCIDLKDEDNYRDVSAIYADIVFCEFNLDRLEGVIEHGEVFLKQQNLSELSQCMIHGLLANAYLMIREDKKAIINLKRYFELYELLNSNIELRMSQSTAVVALAFSWNMLNRTWYFGLCKAVLVEDEQLLIYLMDKKKYLTHVLAPNESKWQGRLIVMMGKSQYKERYADTILAVMEEPKVATVICEELLKLKDEDEKTFLDIAGLLVDNNSINPYIKALRAIYYGMKGEVNKLREINERIDKSTQM